VGHTSLTRRASLVVAIALLALALPAPALAAGAHPVLAQASILGSVWHAISGTVMGAFTWTIKLASNFILDTLGGLVKLLIPRSWAHKGAEIMAWLVAVPDYAGKVRSPGGGHQYGFAGVNDLRAVFAWLGVALAPLTLTHALARNMFDESEPIGVPVLRLLVVVVAVLSYQYWWAQAAALSDSVTHAILTVPSVTEGLQKLMVYATDGVALGGWQLIDLALMAAIGVELLMLIFMKVCLILMGAILYAIGPMMIGLVPTRFGHTIARAWMSAALFLLAFGVAWATILAVGAVLVNDASTAGPLIAGNTGFGQLVGGLIVAVAGLAALWLCLRIAREIGGLLRIHLGGMLALGAGGLGFAAGHTTSTAGASQQTTGASLRAFGAKVATAAGAAGGELAATVPGGAQTGAALNAGRYVGRHGLGGTALAGARAAGSRTAPAAAAVLNRTRAGQVAVRMARSGTASWQSQAGPGRDGGRAPTPAADPSRVDAGVGASRSTRTREATASSAAQPATAGAQGAALARSRRKPRGSAAPGTNGTGQAGSGNERSSATVARGGESTSEPAAASSADRVRSRQQRPLTGDGGRPGGAERQSSAGERGRGNAARSQRRSAPPPPATNRGNPPPPPAGRSSSSSTSPDTPQRPEGPQPRPQSAARPGAPATPPTPNAKTTPGRDEPPPPRPARSSSPTPTTPDRSSR
jgi:hypothetical protein